MKSGIEVMTLIRHKATGFTALVSTHTGISPARYTKFLKRFKVKHVDLMLLSCQTTPLLKQVPWYSPTYYLLNMINGRESIERHGSLPTAEFITSYAKVVKPKYLGDSF